MEQEKKFLHGTLELTIFNATHQSPSHFFNCFCLEEAMPSYVRIKIGKTKVAETKHKRHNQTWNQAFRILCSHSIDTTITLSLKTPFSTLGKVRIRASSMLTKTDFATASHCLLTNKGRSNTKLKLVFGLRFSPAESEVDWGKGVCQGYSGLVSGVTFPQRSKCSVLLYQDSHHGRGFRVPIVGYRPRRLWEDVYKAIDGAKKFIYIAAWSFNPTLVLVRDHETDIPEAVGVEIGKLLIQKAEEGVAVRIMVWDDETSLPFIKNQGVMRTHDEQACSYFKHTKVVCKLCPRLHHNFPTFFAHHQKTISMDASVEQFLNGSTVASKLRGCGEDRECREIISFVGGVDLCDGRYDTEEHSLFQTLKSGECHGRDFYQINFAGASLDKGGPREPWHDAHACLMGEAARDVVANFEQRWAKQCDPSLLTPAGLLYGIGHHHHHGSYNVQLFRSIDLVSVPTLPDANSSSESSIHDAYVAAIRRAKNFIYIENQYFIGGCHLWDQDQNSGCINLIPIELALKVASKIRSNERFTVYIVMPMWPEGEPESETVQDILHWTKLTMTMMYKLIGDAIEEGGSSSRPTDYLNFFWLANREDRGCGEYIPFDSPPFMSNYWRAQKNRRFMIYVHSKIMIVDDEYILIGSANVNQRSMDGDRDTEIAIGCYQPKHIQNTDNGSGSDGDIHKYRLSLWYEHTSRIDKSFLDPKSIECVRKMKEIGEKMWGVYNEAAVVDMRGVHLVSYPMDVSKDGSIQDLVGMFPDTNTFIKGKRAKLLPPLSTT